MKLIDSEIKAAQPKSKPYKLADGEGLVLLIQPNGSKWWRFRYRFGGKENTISFGVYPKISLKEARKKQDAARELLDQGIDPSAHRQAESHRQAIAAASSFESVARQWLEHWGTTKAPRHVKQITATLEKDVFPIIGSRLVTELTAPMLITVIKKLEARGAPDVARRTLNTIGQILRYAIAHGLAERNPATDIRPSDVLKPFKKTHYPRIDQKDLPELLLKIDNYSGQPLTVLAMQLMTLTFLRTKELINARWDDIDFDSSLWRVPFDDMKKKRPHLVPLASQVIVILEKIKEFTGGQPLIFPSQRADGRTMGSRTILGALERMGYKGQMSGHGFRGLASTILHEKGYAHDPIELQLSHKVGGQVSRAYNHALHLEQRTKMMEDWADYLDELRSKTDKLYLK